MRDEKFNLLIFDLEQRSIHKVYENVHNSTFAKVGKFLVLVVGYSKIEIYDFFTHELVKKWIP